MVESYPLYWPDQWNRTPAGLRAFNNSFLSGFGRVRDGLLAELARLGATDVVLSSNIPLRRDGLPYANQRRPDDPGIAVYFKYHGKPMCFACDQYATVAQNTRAIALTIAALRGIERWGASDMMERAFRGFTAIPERASQPWREVFGFKADEVMTLDLIEQRFRALAHQHHPDKGGDAVLFNQLVFAREQARRDVSATTAR